MLMLRHRGQAVTSIELLRYVSEWRTQMARAAPTTAALPPLEQQDEVVRLKQELAEATRAVSEVESELEDTQTLLLQHPVSDLCRLVLQTPLG